MELWRYLGKNQNLIQDWEDRMTTIKNSRFSCKRGKVGAFFLAKMPIFLLNIQPRRDTRVKM